MRFASHGTRALRRRILLILLIVLNCSSASPPCEARTRVVRAVTLSAAPRRQTPEDVSQPSTTARPRKRPSRFKRFAREFLDVLSCHPAKYRKELELARYGPQFPKNYDPRDFSIHAFVKGGWPINLIYELEKNSTLTVTVRMMGVRPFTTTFGPAAAGEVRGFILPREFGRVPQAGVISFRANTDISGRKRLADFQLLAFDIGGSTIQSTGITRPSLVDDFHLRVASYDSRPPGTPPPPQTDTTSIYDVNMALRGAGRNARVDFSFRTRKSYGRWAAEFRTEQRTTEIEAEIPFDERISSRDNLIKKTWDGSRRPGLRARPGLYQVWIKAWWGPFDGGQSAAARESRPRRIDW